MRIVKDLDIDLAGRDVLVVEDVVDSGLTLSYLRRNLLARNPAEPRGLCAAVAGQPPDESQVGRRGPLRRIHDR